MATPYVGEIRLFAGNFAPQGWAFCNGQILPIAQTEALFNLIGTTYGGDGQTNFQLPNLQGRVPIHQGIGHAIGTVAGSETVTLTVGEMPAHSHLASGASAGNAVSPANNFWSTDPGGNTAAYSSAAPDSTMGTNAIHVIGGSQPHDNMSPFLVLAYIISLFGIFPSQA